LDQLQLLAKAADREAAAQGLLDSHITTAAVAASMSDGGKMLKIVQKHLIKRSGGLEKREPKSRVKPRKT
jgi:hypothetical protein